MSKASEFADVCNKLSFHIHGCIEVGTVTRKGVLLIGNLSTGSTVTMDPSDALKLADWIYATFGESEREEGKDG